MISENNNFKEDNSNTKVSYTEFSELNNFSSNNELNSTIMNIRNYLKDINSDWLSQFESLNDLRRLNKHQPKLFLEVFYEISLEFPKLIISIRSNIAKLALILLKEFFENEIYYIKNRYTENQNFNTINLNKSAFKNNSNVRLSEVSTSSFNSDRMGSSRFSELSNVSIYDNEFNSTQNNNFDFSNFSNIIHSIFDTVIPYILLQSYTMKSFLKEEANKCLENISKYSQNFYFLKKINLQINNKNISYAENAFNTTNNLLINLLSKNSVFFDYQNPTNKSLQNLKEIMDINIGLYNLKKDIYSKKAIKLMNCLRDKVGNEIFDVLKSNYDNHSKLIIDNMINEANKNNKTTGNFKDYIKSKK